MAIFVIVIVATKASFESFSITHTQYRQTLAAELLQGPQKNNANTRQVVTTYAEAQTLLARFLERDHNEIGELGRTILLSHGTRTKRAAVLLHGMSASPTQFGDFAKMLHERGYNVLVPRLPRHGYSNRLTEALADLSAAQLKDVTTQAVEIAHGLGESVIVVGFSLGGLLAAWTAQFHRVAKIVCIAPFFGISWMPHRFGAMFSSLILRVPNRFHWWDPIKRERQMPAHGYPRYATHAVGQAYRLAYDVLRDAQAHAPRAAAIIVVTNARETTVNNRSVRRLIELWRSQCDGDTVSTFEFTDLPLSHDIIEPLRNPAIVARVYPKLLELVEA